MTQEQIQEIKEYLDGSKVYSPPMNDPAWNEMVLMANWLRDLLSHIDELQKERDELRAFHEAELGVCKKHCDVVKAAIKDMSQCAAGNCKVCGNLNTWCNHNPDKCTGWVWRGVQD